ncbi:Uncharacterized protein dnl_24080 [Desulfonema limicola]|uniref:HTH cro/C1-type domain-containing protein n=1 Tax=Desulfonema limicola TaxID=45656 RepID=A0A975B787_9BACT|nr:hypothetical protein [Desulfonema limicola]QTA80121.1 Uncharacterized protein dnl_24080 [Desulfonema limicola]
MKKQDVPQDNGINEGVKEITYAVDENGRYTLVQSVGWEPKTIVNDQAWEAITHDIIEQIKLIRAGKRSPLAFHMVKNLMDAGLLASYVNLPRWRVNRHLNPKIYNKLKPEILARYADVFGISINQLNEVPDISETDFYKEQS